MVLDYFKPKNIDEADGVFLVTLQCTEENIISSSFQWQKRLHHGEIQTQGLYASNNKHTKNI